MAAADEIARLKSELGAIYLDSGDCIKTGNLGVPLRPEPAWDRLARAGCDASVLGNRETHVLPAAFEAKLRGARHPLLCGNLRTKDGGRPLPRTLRLDRNGLKIGVLSVMLPMVTERMSTKAASAYLWDPPLETARSLAAELRGACDLVIALTHIGHRQDRLLAEACPEIDVILGGHSHTVLEQPERVGRTWVCQGGSHGRFIGVYSWGDGALTGGLHALPR